MTIRSEAFWYSRTTAAIVMATKSLSHMLEMDCGQKNQVYYTGYDLTTSTRVLMAALHTLHLVTFFAQTVQQFRW